MDLAEYYSTFEIKDARQVSLGKPLGSHLRLLRSTKLWPLKAIFDMDQYSWERNKHDARGMFYAQSWALVHYLIQGNDGKGLQQFGEFLQLIKNNTQVDTAFLHMNRSEEAVAKLQQALALDPDRQMGHASLGRALLKQKKYSEANITTFTPDVVGELTCGVRKAPESVILTYSGQRMS